MKTDIFLKLERKILEAEPLPDIAICSNCGWTGNVEECEVGQDGDWETGYFLVDLCPICEDGGCIDDYDMTAKRRKEWEKWMSEEEKEG